VKQSNIIQQLTFNFALRIIGLAKKLSEKKEYILSRQLLKAGTSIGANVEEAIAGQSRKDFISKLAIALKEARETNYWLRLFEKGNVIEMDFSSLLNEFNVIMKILTKIITTSQANNY
jgi:four helix bundle protein